MNKTQLAIFIAVLASQTACWKSTTSQERSKVHEKPAIGSPSPEKHYPNLKVQAPHLNTAVLNGDYAKIADLTYPKLIELMGGRAKFLSFLEQSMKEMHSGEFRILSNASDEPRDIIEEGNEIFAIVPTTMRSKVPDGVLVGRSFLIGVSKDGGENWTFVESGGKEIDQRQLRTLFPTAANRLRLPEAKPPVLQRDSAQ